MPSRLHHSHDTDDSGGGISESEFIPTSADEWPLASIHHKAASPEVIELRPIPLSSFGGDMDSKSAV